MTTNSIKPLVGNRSTAYFRQVRKVLFLLSCLGMLAGTVSYAQVPIQKSTEKVKINGATYYIHTVKRGETLYSLSKAYEVTIQQLTDTNPELASGLKEGQHLKIPVIAPGKTTTPATTAPAATAATPPTPVATPEPVKNTPEPEVKKDNTDLKKETPVRPEYYLVKASDQLKDIAEKYETTEEKLQKLNPEAFFNGKLQPGTLLQLPPIAQPETIVDTIPAKRNPVYMELKSAAKTTAPSLQGAIKAALVLPLIRNWQNDTLSGTKNPENFYAFYEGALLAIEALKQEGLSLQLSVYDSYHEGKIAELVESGALLDNDIIIGPVYANNLKPVAQFAQEHHIKIVSPLDPNAEVLTIGNPYFFQLSPPAFCRQKKLVDNILARENTNIILVYEEGGRDSLMVEDYKYLFGEQLNNVRLLAHKVVKGAAVQETLKNLLVVGKMNCVLVASNNDALASDIAASLYLFTLHNKFQMTLFGTERWRGFETVDLQYLHTLNLHLVVPFFLDYEDAKVKNFVVDFQRIYGTDPSQYAFQGYDTFYYFLQAILQYGKDFENYLAYHNPSLLQTQYRFKYNESYDNGLVNVESCLINYTPDYRIERR